MNVLSFYTIPIERENDHPLKSKIIKRTNISRHKKPNAINNSTFEAFLCFLRNAKPTIVSISVSRISAAKVPTIAPIIESKPKSMNGAKINPMKPINSVPHKIMFE